MHEIQSSHTDLCASFQRAQELLAVLQPVQHQGWQYVVTLDESWFFEGIDWGQQWLPADDEPGAWRRRGINHEKTLLTVVWNTQGFHLIDTMPRREKFSTRYFVDKILTPISAQLIPTRRRKLGIHADNSGYHSAKVVLDFMPQKQTKLAPHRSYSPDLAPSDFSIFDHLKEGLRGSFFQTSNQLLNAGADYCMISRLRCYLMFSTNGLPLRTSHHNGRWPL
jgi:hypothetical protein